MADEETGKDVHEQRKKEMLQFELLKERDRIKQDIKQDLDQYGQIMQGCIEEAEKTLQIWRGKETMTAFDDQMFVVMMPPISLALFEKVTKRAELRDIVERIKGIPSCSTSTGQYKVIEGKDILAWFRETIDGKGEGAKAQC